MDDDIWFEKWGGSYMPCHWKGWAFVVAQVGLAFLVIGAVYLLSLVVPWLDFEYAGIAAFLVILFVGFRVADRHSRQR